MVVFDDLFLRSLEGFVGCGDYRFFGSPKGLVGFGGYVLDTRRFGLMVVVVVEVFGSLFLLLLYLLFCLFVCFVYSVTLKFMV